MRAHRVLRKASLPAAALAACVTACSSGKVSGADDAGAVEAGVDAHGDAATAASDAPVADAGAPGPDASDAALADVAPTGCIWDQPDAMPSVAHGPTCGAAKQASAVAAMDKAPIALPGKAAGLDLRSGDAGFLTLAQAEAIDCQSAYLGDEFGDCSVAASWGPNGEVVLDYDPLTGDGQFIVLFPGYAGTLAFHSPDGQSSYAMALGSSPLKNGAPFPLDQGWSGAAFESEVDELYRGLVSTFAPSVGLDPPGTTCVTTKKCVVGSIGSQGYLLVKPLGFAWYVADVTAAQPTPSAPVRMDLYRP